MDKNSFSNFVFSFKVKLKGKSKKSAKPISGLEKVSNYIFRYIVVLLQKQWEIECFSIGIQSMRLSPGSRRFPPRHHSLTSLLLGQSLLVTSGSIHWYLTITAFNASMVMMLVMHFFCFSKSSCCSRGNCAWIGCFNIRPRRRKRPRRLLFFILFFFQKVLRRQFFNLFSRRFSSDTKSA